MLLRAILPLLCSALLGVSGLYAQEAIGNDRSIRQCDPVLSADGNTLFFSRPDHDRNQGTDGSADIWTMRRRDNGKWGKALNPGSPLNEFGDDRALHLNVDGTRIAVLRSGPESVIDLLERSGRNWRSLHRWPLPPGLTGTTELTFNANSLRLVYARPGGHRRLLRPLPAQCPGRGGVDRREAITATQRHQ